MSSRSGPRSSVHNFLRLPRIASQRGRGCSAKKHCFMICHCIFVKYDEHDGRDVTTTHFDLQFVLMVGVVVREVPEVLGDVETPLETFGGHKVLGHLDAVVDVSNLRKNTLGTRSF